MIQQNQGRSQGGFKGFGRTPHFHQKVQGKNKNKKKKKKKERKEKVKTRKNKYKQTKRTKTIQNRTWLYIIDQLT